MELIRQFYSLPRQFRIAGDLGEYRYVSYTNAGLRPQKQMFLGQDMGLRKPVFDIRISAQRKNVFSTVSQNELALQLFKLGFFNPQLADQAAACLELMDFEGKDELMRDIGRGATMEKQLMMFQQLAFNLAKQHDPQLAVQIAAQIGMQTGAPAPAGGGGEVNLDGGQKEPAQVERAREQARVSTEAR